MTSRVISFFLALFSPGTLPEYGSRTREPILHLRYSRAICSRIHHDEVRHIHRSLRRDGLLSTPRTSSLSDSRSHDSSMTPLTRVDRWIYPSSARGDICPPEDTPCFYRVPGVDPISLYFLYSICMGEFRHEGGYSTATLSRQYLGIHSECWIIRLSPYAVYDDPVIVYWSIYRGTRTRTRDIVQLSPLWPHIFTL